MLLCSSKHKKITFVNPKNIIFFANILQNMKHNKAAPRTPYFAFHSEKGNTEDHSFC